MKSIGGFVGAFIGMFIGAFTGVSGIVVVCCIIGAFVGYAVGTNIEEENENSRRAREEYERRKRQEEYERERKTQRRTEAQALARKYPEATKYYFQHHWGITKSYITDYDITDDKVDTLLGHKYSYEQEEQRRNTIYRQKVEAEREAKRKAEREAAERKRREEERERLRKEEEIRTLPACVASWSSHSNSSLKHKYFFDYYPYNLYKDDATSSMWDAWKTVWNFKNDPSKNISSYAHSSALDTVINLVERALRSAFGSKTEHLTLVCLTASSQRKTELRFEEFSERVCSALNMTNAFSHIRVTEGGDAKHEGGDGVQEKSYDRAFFNGKNVVLFDDVRTTGRSIEQERRILERLGAKVICVITIAQTKH